MPAPLTLDDISDRVRRKLSSTPPIDDRNLPPELRVSGDEHPNDRRFSNPLIYQMVEETVSELNVECGLTGSGDAPIPITITAQTADGPYRVDMSSDFGPRESEINAINRVWWNDGSSNYPMTPTSWRKKEADRFDYWSQVPDIPSEYWVDGYALWIVAAPSAAGTLYVLASKALHGPLTRRDTITNLPADLHTVVVDGTALRICTTQPKDQVLSDAAATLGGPNGLYTRGVNRVKSLMGRMNSQNQDGLVLSNDYRRMGFYR